MPLKDEDEEPDLITGGRLMVPAGRGDGIVHPEVSRNVVVGFESTYISGVSGP